MDRLAALEAEVKAESDAKQARKATALAKLRDQRVTNAASDAARSKSRSDAASDDEPAKLSDRRLRAMLDDEPRTKRRNSDDDERPRARRRGADEQIEDMSGAIELAAKANRVRKELTRAPAHGDKSWAKSAIASFALGPIGWLYAGSLREAVPASAAWTVAGLAAWKFLPFLLMPMMMVALPLSAIAGVVYALQYNRSGSRQRLFNSDKAAETKQLKGG